MGCAWPEFNSPLPDKTAQPLMIITKEARPAELDLALKSPTTAFDLEMLWKSIDFPRDVTGLLILDIGSGASLATTRLREMGARAFAVDFRYRDLKEMRRSIHGYLMDPFKGARLSKEGKKFIKRMKKSQATFFNDIGANDGSYVASLAGNLPFPDETFDICYSKACMTPNLIRDLDVFIPVFYEAMRVLKKGGELQISPWYIERLGVNTAQVDNSKRFIEYLKAQRINYTIEPGETVEWETHMRLRVTNGLPRNSDSRGHE